MKLLFLFLLFSLVRIGNNEEKKLPFHKHLEQ